MGAEPEPQGEVTFSAEQKVDNFLKSKTKDHKETSPQGLSGPELQAQVRVLPSAPPPQARARHTRELHLPPHGLVLLHLIRAI